MRRCLVAGAAAAVLLGGADAFAPSAFAPSAGSLSRACVPDQQAPRSSLPVLRMGLGDLFQNAFANNPNIPSQPATGPGSPGFSPKKAVVEKEQEPVPPPPTAALWQQATDPSSGKPYWWNTQTSETTWTPPASSPPPMPPPPVVAPEPVFKPPVATKKEEPKEDRGPTGPSLERQLINLNKFLVNGIIDQEEYNFQKEAIKAQMETGPVFEAESLVRPFTTTTVKWGALIDVKIPQRWIEGEDYDRLEKLQPGSLVGINRSDGSIRFGQVVEKGGLLWEDRWKVVVSMKDDGKPGAIREEEGVMLLRPKQSGMAIVLDAMPDITVTDEAIDLSAGNKQKGFFGSMFAEPVFEGGSAAPLMPIQPPGGQVAKAVVPQGIIPTAVPPAGVPKAVVPPQGMPQPGNAPSGVPQQGAAPPADKPKTSEWI